MLSFSRTLMLFIAFFLVQTALSAQAPVVTLGAGPAAFVEDVSGAVQLDATATVTDPDSADFDTGSLTLSITANNTASDRLFATSGGGISVAYSPGTNEYLINDFSNVFASYPELTTENGVGTNDLVITFNSFCTPALAQIVLRSIRYNNVSNDPSTLTRTVQVTVNDGDGNNSNQPTIGVTVAGTNDAPTLTTMTTITGTEDTAEAITHTVLAANGNEADVDSATINFLVISVPTGSLLINGNPWAVTTNDLIDAAATVLWTPPTDENTDTNPGAHIAFTVRATDGALDSGSNVNVLVDLAADNDDPTFTAGLNQTINEDNGGGPLAILVPVWATGIDEG
ncbi:VCBS domain-containing protein, partial [Planctomycetota bacterium]|nr:VCBS domain-containing protein [Planctomycetota bacterium]